MTTDTKNKIGVVIGVAFLAVALTLAAPFLFTNTIDAAVFRGGLTSPTVLAAVFLLAGWLCLERYIPRVRRQRKDARAEKREGRGGE